MKTINLPIVAENSIDLSAITYDTNGIIIVYKNNKPIGHILYDSGEEEWKYFSTIATYDSVSSHFNLIDIIKELEEDCGATEFKLLEYE